MNIFSRDPFDDRSGGLRRRLVGLPPVLKWGAMGAALASLIFIGWLGLQGLAAKSNLEKARDSAEQAKDALLEGKSEDATRFAENAQFFAGQARAATHSVPWSIAAAVPLLGSPLKTTQQISDVVVGLAQDVLLPAAGMGAGLSPDKLIDGTRINLKLLREEEPRLSELSATVAKLDVDAQAIANPLYLSLIRDARSQLQAQTAGLARLLSNTALAAKLAPSMLGAEGPRTYLMGFQSPAEARGTGGLLGGVGTLRFNNGSPTVETLSSNAELKQAVAKIDLGPEFRRVYGWMNPLTDYRNSNMSPHFPYAAQIWKSMWEDQTRVPVDGVIATDPVALSYILGAVGPVTLPDGEEVNQDNVVELTMSAAYARFPGSERDPYFNQSARKQFLQNISSAVINKVIGPIKSPRKLLDAIGKAASEGRVAVWSASPADQKLLEETPLAHAVPDDDAPYAQVVVNNLAGNKMDYYLTRDIEYVADGCDADMRNSTIVVRLSNTAENVDQLPDYVTQTLGLSNPFPGTDRPASGIELDAPRGTMVTSVRVLATNGAKLMNVTSNGEKTPAITHVENGRPSFEVQVVIPPGQSGELTFRLSEPTSAGEPRAPLQPLVDNASPAVSVPVCE